MKAVGEKQLTSHGASSMLKVGEPWRGFVSQGDLEEQQVWKKKKISRLAHLTREGSEEKQLLVSGRSLPQAQRRGGSSQAEPGPDSAHGGCQLYTAFPRVLHNNVPSATRLGDCAHDRPSKQAESMSTLWKRHCANPPE
ncbi:uncharacterized protein J5F26_010708 [Ciconia maguari]